MIETNVFKTTPFKHQDECFELSKNKVAYGIFFEQGLGKTKVAIDTAAHLHVNKNVVDAVLVAAPNGVHSNWVRREIPAHLTDLVEPNYVEYDSTKMSTKRFQKQFDSALTADFPILAMNIESFSSGTKAFKLAETFLKKRKCIFILDESSRIKTPSSTRTKNILKLGNLAVARRILSGTPVTQSPLDLYSQFMFLHEDFLGFKSFFSFKHQYAVWKQRQIRETRPHMLKQGKSTRAFEELVKYIRLDDLKNRIAPHCFRRTKKECLDIPDKIYQVVDINMTKEQKAFYDRLEKDGVIEFNDFREISQHQLTKLLRLQQIIGGFIPTDDPEQPGEAVPGKNPKLDYLLEAVENDYPGKAIIWARFKYEIELICKALRAKYGRKAVVELHGSIPSEQRQENIDRFQNDPTCRFTVGQQQCGIGYTMHAAETVFYYSNSFSYEDRYQSEDRAHRIGLRHPVVYIDLIMQNTVDSHIKDVLQKSLNTADLVTGDRERLGK